MELSETTQVDFSRVLQLSFDVVIVACGYESRCTRVLEQLSQTGRKRIALAFKEDSRALSRKRNENYLKLLDFDFHEASAGNYQDIYRVLERVCPVSGKGDLKILVDYSSMSRAWYEAILNYFNHAELENPSLEVYFTYSPGDKPVNTSIASSKLKEYLKKNPIPLHKPLALVMGQDRGTRVMEDISNLLKPDLTLCFQEDRYVDTRELEELAARTREIAGFVHGNQVTISYPAPALDLLDKSFTSLCLDLRLNYTVILAPFGPKPFNVLCQLMHTRYPDILLIPYLPSSIAPVDQDSTGEIITWKLVYTNEEVEYLD